MTDPVSPEADTLADAARSLLEAMDELADADFTYTLRFSENDQPRFSAAMKATACLRAALAAHDQQGDLLARADWLLESTVGERIAAGVAAEDVVRDLASALRRQLRPGSATYWMEKADRLERELAEARDTREVVWTGIVGELKDARGDIRIQHHTQHVKSTDRVVVLRATAEEDSTDG